MMQDDQRLTDPLEQPQQQIVPVISDEELRTRLDIAIENNPGLNDVNALVGNIINQIIEADTLSPNPQYTNLKDPMDRIYPTYNERYNRILGYREDGFSKLVERVKSMLDEKVDGLNLDFLDSKEQ